MIKNKKLFLKGLFYSVLLSVVLSGLFCSRFFNDKNKLVFLPTLSEKDELKTEIWLCNLKNGISSLKENYNKKDWKEESNCYVYYGQNQTPLSLTIDPSDNTTFKVIKNEFSGGMIIDNNGDRQYYDLYSEQESTLEQNIPKTYKGNYSFSNVFNFSLLFLILVFIFTVFNIFVFQNKWLLIVEFLITFFVTFNFINVSLIQTIIIFIFFLYSLFDYIKNNKYEKYLSLKMYEKIILITITFVASFMIMGISLFMYDESTTMIISIKNLSLYLIFTIFIYFVEELIFTFFSFCERKLYQIKTTTKKSKYWLFFLISFFVLLMWAIAFYPGNLSPDSVSQLYQAVTGKIYNSHPAFMTIILRWFYLLFKNPFSFIIFQNIYFSFMIATIFGYVEKKGVNYRVLLLLSFVIPIIPCIGINNVTLWKDIIYSISLIFLSYYCYRIVINDMKGFFTVPNILVFIFSFVAVREFRHNGLIPFVFVLILLSAIIIKRKDLKLFILTLVCTFFATIGLNFLYNFYKVEIVNFNGSMYNSIAKNFIATVYYTDKLPPKAYSYINKIGDNDYFREHYNPYNIDYLFYNSDESLTRWFNAVNNYKMSEILPEYLKNIYENPKVFIKDRFSSMGIMLDASFISSAVSYNKSLFQDGVYISTSEEENRILKKTIDTRVLKKIIDIDEKEILYYSNNFLSKIFRRYLEISISNEVYIFFFWKAGLYFILFMLLFYYKLIKKDFYKNLGFIPIIANTLSWFIVLNHPSVRYVYYLNMGFVFALLLLMIPEKGKTK